MKKFYFFYCLLLLSFISLLFPELLYSGNGKISGRVTDSQTNEPLIGVTVMIDTVWVSGHPYAQNPKLGAVTNENGYFAILNVPPGFYNVKASMVGYSTYTKAKVQVDADRTITLNIKLTPSSVQMDAIVVTYEREVIKPDVASTQEVIQTARIAEVPIVRVDEFVGNLKGIELVDNNEGHGLSVRGGAIRETDIRIEGISLQDPRSENSYLSLNSTTIQELQVLTGGFQAKYGGIQSGLLNVVTKEGNRDKYNFALKVDITPTAKKKFFGTDPYSNESPIYQVFAGKYAMNGIKTKEDSLAVPPEFWGFKGWNDPSTGNYPDLPKDAKLTPEQKLQLWKLRHPQYSYGKKPDIYIETSLSGPLPGGELPLLGEYFRNTTFLLGFKYENSQFAFPVGPRDSYIDWNTQLKLTSVLSPNMRLSVDGMYAKISSLNEGSATNYGGTLVDPSSSFNFISNSEPSVKRQAALIGSDNFYRMFNKSRLQYYDQRYIIGGVKFTHTLSASSFYTVNLHFGYTDHELRPFSLDTTKPDAWITIGGYRFLNVPNGGTPNASTNWATDELNMFWLYGGTQRDDSSYSWTVQLSSDFTSQLGEHNQFEAGISAKLTYLYTYGGTWLQSERMWTTDTWQYYKVTPIELGAYLQDKIEFEGMIANAGVRLDIFDPNKKGFIVTNPPDQSYSDFYNKVYMNLPGGWGSYERWQIYKDMLENPPNWPREKNKLQAQISPRLSVSFPITTESKLYFNYGHFYQRAPVSFLYNLNVYPSAVTLPNPNLSMGRTVSYEFGYEQQFLENFLFNVAFYYKDFRNQPLSQSYINYYHDNIVTTYVPDKYKDVRGVELRLERTFGKWITFWANYDYMLQSYGQSGLQKIYENKLEASDERRSANLTTTIPLPRAHINVNLRTPSDWGPKLFDMNILGDIYVNFLFKWQDGGEMLWNPQESDIKKQQWLDIVDYSNLDMRASKLFKFTGYNVEVVLTVQNLLNQKRLEVGNMTRNQLDNYKSSLKLPFNEGDKKGDDKWGEWDKSHIDIGWWQAPLFLNPRRVLLGVRIDL